MNQNQVVITLTGISAVGYHGVFAHERSQGQIFVVDACLTVVTDGSDEVDGTVNYATLADAIVAQIGSDPVNLIETLAERIAANVLAEPRVTSATITVHKPQAPLQVTFDDVSVTVTRSRS